MRKNIFLLLASIGLVTPFYFFFPFFRATGFDIALFFRQIFANSISTAIAVDMTISVIAFWIFMFAEAKKLQMKNAWLYVLASLTIGFCFALPLFLYFRERKLEMK